jgi:3-hydroxybutyryl-CoA dehydrogenase
MEVDAIRHIGVVGAGLMGHGIALEFALAGYEVVLVDQSEEKLQQAMGQARANLQMLAATGMANASKEPAQQEAVLARIHPSTRLVDAAAQADVVIEAVFENLELKQAIFAQLDQAAPPHTILASNTSTLLPSKLAAATQRPDKVLIAHYFNPPFLLPLVELVRHAATSDETVMTMHALVSKIGKKPAIVQKEVPGFIGNRLQFAMLREALSIVEQGIARPEDVDIVVKNGFGRRLAAAGPFELGELGGWDVYLAVLQYIQPRIDASAEVSAMLREKVEAGELGVKTLQGFYEWTPETAQALREHVAKVLATVARLS